MSNCCFSTLVKKW